MQPNPGSCSGTVIKGLKTLGGGGGGDEADLESDRHTPSSHKEMNILTHCVHTLNCEWEWWLSSQQYLPLLQRIKVWFTAPMQQLRPSVIPILGYTLTSFVL